MDAKGISATVDLIQKAIKLGKKTTNLEYEEALLAAREAIASQRDENLQLKEENYKLKIENEKLKKQQALEVDVEYVNGAYWHKNANRWEGPFCTGCWVDNKKLVHLSYIGLGRVGWSCPSCKVNFGFEVKKRHPQDEPPRARVEQSPLQIQ